MTNIQDPDFASGKPGANQINTVDKVTLYNCQGPFTTKTDASLCVGANLPYGNTTMASCIPEGLHLKNFLHVSQEEENLLKKHVRETHTNFNYDISSLRIYFQTGMPPGQVAGNEFHRIRREAMIVSEGSLEAKFEDLHGNKRIETLGNGKGIIIPPFIMHSLIPKEKSSLIFIANTIFYHNLGSEVIEIRDTYSRETFEKIKRQI